MQFNTPRDMKDAFKKLKDQHKVSENVKRSWYIVLYVLFREKGATDWTLAKMYLKYTQSAGAKYVGTEIEALLNNPLPGTLKAIDRKFNSSVHLTRTFKLDYGIYKL